VAISADAFSTVTDAFRDAVRQLPGNECLRVPRSPGRDYLPDGLSMTYAETAREVDRLRARYREAGYGPGHRIAILTANHPVFVLHFLALNDLGVCVVPVNPEYRFTEIEALMRTSRAVLAVALPARVDDFRQVVPHLPSPVPVVSVDEFGSPLPKAVRTAQGPLGRTAEAGLLYTSGTSGMPKGCLLTNDAFLFNGERYDNAGGVMTMKYGEERLYNPLPLYYANAFSITNVAMILLAGCMIFPDRFHPSTFWREIVETDATVVHHLGMIPPVLLKQEPVPQERQHRLKFSGGAGVDPEQHAELEERFGFPFVEFFGMSEVGICAADHREPRKRDTRSVGRPWPGVEFRLVDENEQEVPPGVSGQLCLRRTGSDPRLGLCGAYLDDPETTEEVWRGGWFHTGDVLTRDAEGRYYFQDRIKHMIRRSGQNMSAAEIESMLQAHPAVAEVAVVPAPDEVRQEEVLACIVLADGHRPDAATAEAIFEHSLGRLAYFKAPGWLLFVTELPKTSTHKLQKSALFADLEDPRTAPGIFDFRDRKKRALNLAVT
jgi:acyl-CoA synthetase (AMP-forming)/AMP-acid ligase II